MTLRRFVFRGGLFLLGATLSFSDCDCDNPTLHGICPPGLECQDSSTCSGGATCIDKCCGGLVECYDPDYPCKGQGECCKDGKCTTECGPACTTKTCERNADCADQGVCMECKDSCCRSFACTSDSDCPPDGTQPRFCTPDPDPDLGCRVCDYVRCESDAQCQDSGFPLYQECAGDTFGCCKLGECKCCAPCGGTCPDGKYCCRQDQLCRDIPVACEGVTCPACEQVNPDPGGSVSEQSCAIEGADCSCLPLPPLPDAFAGQHSAVALGADGVPVFSGYFGRPYGDLIFGVAEAAQAGATVRWSFVDGVPAGAPCVGAAAGPRGGIAEPGDDVGWDTDIAVGADGLPRISYYDRTHGDLKYAAFDGAQWTVQVVDNQGDTGRFTSLAIDSQGRPLIAYMTVKDNLHASLRLAWATVPNPAAMTDWSIYVADTAAVPCAPGDCAAGSVCLKDSGACATADDPANCGGGAGCGSDQACVAGGCQDLMPESSLEDLPPGVGLFASLALYPGDVPAVAYYDSLRGNLKFVLFNTSAGSFGAPVTLAGEDGGGHDLGNLGAEATLAIGADSRVHIAFQDADLGSLYYLSFPGTNVAAAAIELVDAGARDANGDPTDPAHAAEGLHWVGNYASILLDTAGNVRLAYQDGTSLDLDYAIRNPAGVWAVEVLARKLAGDAFEGAYGFFADQVMNADGDLAWVSNFKHNLRTDPYSSKLDLRAR